MRWPSILFDGDSSAAAGGGSRPGETIRTHSAEGAPHPQMSNHPTNDKRPSRDFDDADFLRGLPRTAGAPVVGPVKLGARISKGGMGVIYRGFHTKLDIDVAVKFLLPDRAQDNSDDLRRFMREARLAAQLNSENLVRVFDVNSQGKYHYVVMEFVRGETARERVERKGPLAESEALDIVVGAARGLDAAHRKSIVHRDIKPDNIMIDVTGLVKLADLGIAKAHGEAAESHETITQPGLLIGTPAYMAPEQMKFHGQVGSAADIYGMGSTLYYFLTGKAPFEGTLISIIQAVTMKGFPDIRKERPQVSEPLLKLLDRCTRSDPRQRISNAAALLEEIKRLGHERRSLATATEHLPTAQTSVRPPPAIPKQKVHLQKPATVDRAARAKIAAQKKARARGQGRRQPVLGSYLVVLLLGACLFAAAYYTYREFLAGAPSRGSTASAMEKPAAKSGAQKEGASEKELDQVSETPAETAEPAEKERWEELSPAESSPIRALLEAWPTHEKEIHRLLESLCAAENGDIGKGTGIACELAHSEFLAFLRKLPAAGASREDLESLVAFLDSTPAPPTRLAALRAAHGEERQRVLAVYLGFVSREARSLLDGGDPAGASALLDQVLQFARQRKLAQISPKAAIELQDLRNRIPDPAAAAPSAAEEPAVESPRVVATSEVAPPVEASAEAARQPAAVPYDLPWAQGLASSFQIEWARTAGVPLAREVALGGGVTMRFLYVPEGNFIRGGGPDGPPRRVRLSRGFYLGIHEVTWDQWRAVMGTDPPGVPPRRRAKEMGELPAVGVSWDEAIRFCRLVNERLAAEGTPGQLRLSTEAEWEYACRTGSHGPFPWGDEFSEDHIWYWMNSQRRPQQVGGKRPNAWGFFDVLGNVNEWCADWLEPFPPGDLTDPAGPASGTVRVLRGGSWKDYKAQIRPGLRRGLPPGRGDPETGFRAAMDG